MKFIFSKKKMKEKIKNLLILLIKQAKLIANRLNLYKFESLKILFVFNH